MKRNFYKRKKTHTHTLFLLIFYLCEWKPPSCLLMELSDKGKSVNWPCLCGAIFMEHCRSFHVLFHCFCGGRPQAWTLVQQKKKEKTKEIGKHRIRLLTGWKCVSMWLVCISLHIQSCVHVSEHCWCFFTLRSTCHSSHVITLYLQTWWIAAFVMLKVKVIWACRPKRLNLKAAYLQSVFTFVVRWWPVATLVVITVAKGEVRSSCLVLKYLYREEVSVGSNKHRFVFHSFRRLLFLSSARSELNWELF